MITMLPPAAALVIAFLVFFGYVSPTYSGSITDLRASIDRQQSALDAADRFNKKQYELVEQENAMPADKLERLRAMLPDSVDNVGVIIDLTSHTENSSVQLTSISVPPPAKADDPLAVSTIGALDFTLSVKGTYQAFLGFLAGIEHSLRLLDVTSLSISGSDTGVYTYTMTLRLYWLH